MHERSVRMTLTSLLLALKTSKLITQLINYKLHHYFTYGNTNNVHLETALALPTTTDTHKLLSQVYSAVPTVLLIAATTNTLRTHTHNVQFL
jgi:hypothetical protein